MTHPYLIFSIFIIMCFIYHDTNAYVHGSPLAKPRRCNASTDSFIRCACLYNTDCDADAYCDKGDSFRSPLFGRCAKKKEKNKLCNQHGECLSNICERYCSDTRGIQCQSDSDCLHNPNQYCNKKTNACVPKKYGGFCSRDQECLTHHCFLYVKCRTPK